MKHLLVASFLFASLFANQESPIPPMSSAVESIGMLAGCVDVASGAYVGSKPEVTVNCHEPISLYRQHVCCSDGVAGEGNKKIPKWFDAPSTSFWQLGKEYIHFSSGRHRKKTRYRLVGEAGEVTDYVAVESDISFHDGGSFLLRVDPNQFVSNTAYGEIGGRTHPRNSQLRYGSPAPEHAHYGPVLLL